MSPTPVYIICSPRPLVGKTLIARLLSEFLLLKDGAVCSFDINLKEPSLLEYLPRITETADVVDTFGKMQLMDRLIVDDGIAKVIDLGFHAFDEFFKMTHQIGFLKEAARRGVAPVVLFVADTDRISARSYPTLQRTDPAEGADHDRQRTCGARRIAEGDGGGRVLRISALPSFLKTYIDRVNFSFTDYLRNERTPRPSCISGSGGTTSVFASLSSAWRRSSRESLRWDLISQYYPGNIDVARLVWHRSTSTQLEV